MSFSRDMIKKHNLKLTKRFGQNFLTDETILDKIVEVSEVDKEDFILEIGPGAGALTRKLCEKAGYVLAVEIDKQLIPALEDGLNGYENIEIINEDAMKYSFKNKMDEIIKKYNLKNAKVVANLPYYITTPIIMRFLEDEKYFKLLTFMVQKEVALRMTAKPSTKDYGALSLAVQYYTEPKIQFKVSPNAFIPPPEVDSSVITLSVHKNPPVKLFEETLFFKVIKASFGQRRKTILNALKNFSSLGLTKEKIIDMLEFTGINQMRRGETLSIDDFAKLANEIYSRTNFQKN